MWRATERETAFAAFLKDLVDKEDRAALAALRRGLGKEPGASADMYPYVVPWLPQEVPPWQEEAYYLIASLFAMHQISWLAPAATSNLGASLNMLAQVSPNSESVEKRFVALLNCHREDLPGHLRYAVSLLKSKDMPIDWALLLHEIQGWDWESRAVQREWARAFWRRPAQASTEADSATNQVTEA